jgi:hypothetical protein
MLKQVLTTLVLCLFIVPVIFAQKIQESKIPEAVKTAFSKEYPAVTRLKWEKEDGHYEANFMMNKAAHSVTLDANGKVVEREVEIPATELPAGVLAYVKEHYPGKKVNEMAKITDAKNEVSYEVELKRMDLIFSSTGKFIKELKD